MKHTTRRRSLASTARRTNRIYSLTASSQSLTRVLLEYAEDEHDVHSISSSTPTGSILKKGGSANGSATKRVRFTSYNQILNTADPAVEEWVLMDNGAHSSR